jgi:hypothetical protein
MEHYATSTKPSLLEVQTIPFPSPKGEPRLVEQYLRNATGFLAPATAQRHIRNVLNPARHTIEHNHNLNRA